MKKTFRRALVLTVVIAVLTVCAFAMSASAASCHGTSESWEEVYTAPTCTQDGYSDYYCKFCGELAYTTKDVSDPLPMDKAMGHRNLATSYVLSDDGTYYTRVVTCQDGICVRADGDTPAVTGTVTECPTKYYLVEFKNDKASPEIGEVADHADYFLDGYYVADVPETWVVDLSDSDTKDYITKTYEPIFRVSNPCSVDYGSNVTEPSYEFFQEADGTRHLYVKDGETAYANGKAAFLGETPERNNDTTKGGYEFRTWLADGEDISVKKITKNTVFYADFAADKNYSISYVFKNGDTPIFESVHNIAYGSGAEYDGETPTKNKSIQYIYEFAGWRVEDKNATDTEYFTELRAPVNLYHKNVAIYAQYNAIPNRYKIELVKYNGTPFTYNGAPIVCDGVAIYEEILSADIVKTLDFTRPNTETYVFNKTDKWKISAINGNAVVGDTLVGIDMLSLPQSFTVKTKDGEEVTVGYEDYDLITLTPYYESQLIKYSVPVTIDHFYFDEDDLYHDNTPREEILDDFYVAAYDANGNFLDGGQADSQGKVTLRIPFSTTWRFEAVTENGKYFGYTEINSMAFDYESGKPLYEIIHTKNISVAPYLTDAWTEGDVKGCKCVCHSFIGGFLVRIYNFIYRSFGIKYKCCDDLYAAHGDSLLYAKN